MVILRLWQQKVIFDYKPRYLLQMESTTEQIIEQTNNLLKEEKYQEVIEILNDKILYYNNAVLYAHIARAYGNLDENELALSSAQKSIEIDPQLALGYFIRGGVMLNLEEPDKAIADYDKAIEIDPNYKRAYNMRGVCWYEKQEYDKAIADINEAIQIDPNDERPHFDRGMCWHAKKEYDKAIADYNEAIRLKDSYEIAYNNRGNVWSNKKEYDKAIADYNEAIRLESHRAGFYLNRGQAWLKKKEYDKAITDNNEAIRLDPNEAGAYFNRGTTWFQRKEYDKAIKDYERYIKLTNDPSDYYQQVAISKIEELKIIIENVWYEEIDTIVREIKQVLLFDSPFLTHYTSLSGARAMILQNSDFRLSEGAFLNDTSEGRELFKFLSLETTVRTDDETMAESFAERPFIGSFVAENKHNDLTLWRMYGKEAQAEAKGCALTINKDSFIDSIKKKISPIDNIAEEQSEEQFTFYNVAYLSDNVFVIPGKDNSIAKSLNALMSDLKDKIKELDIDQKSRVTELLNEIAYLFKSSEYQYENEVRLVVQGVGFAKTIKEENNLPKVYIELVDIVPSLKKITLGPKVERADEWAAAFNYNIKAQLKDIEKKVEIIISHLPFK